LYFQPETQGVKHTSKLFFQETIIDDSQLIIHE